MDINQYVAFTDAVANTGNIIACAYGLYLFVKKFADNSDKKNLIISAIVESL